MSYSYDNQHLGGMPAPKKKLPMWLVLVIIAAVGLLVLCGIVSVVALMAPSAKPTPTPTATHAAAAPLQTQSPSPSPSPSPTKSISPPPPPPPPPPTIVDGTWTVGEDFPVGNYQTIGAASNCYWAIYKSGTNQDLGSIVNNHFGGGNLRVTLKRGQDFETKRCGTWKKVG
jgi:hypothetical protein